MSFEPTMWCIFCDDVRQEAGNKVSYMGIYGPNLVVPSFPTTLVKLCCILNVRVPAGSIPTSIGFKLLRDDEVIFESELPAESYHPLVVPPGDLDLQALTVSVVAQLLSFPVTQQASLKARAYIDGKELRGGTLVIQAAASATQS